jgi:hypothetical protein
MIIALIVGPWGLACSARGGRRPRRPAPATQESSVRKEDDRYVTPSKHGARLTTASQTWRGGPPSRYEEAVIRWLGRLCLERPTTTITELRVALAAFERLPDEPEDAEAELRRLVRH